MTLNLNIKKTSKNFENPKIYILSSPHTNLFYIGSTCMSLAVRLRNHNELYKQFVKGSHNNKCSAFKLFEFGDVKIDVIDDCKDICCKKALLKRERFWIENKEYITNINGILVNKNIPSRTIKESSKAHYEKNKEEKKQYYINNREAKIKYAKEYIKANKDKYNEYQKQYKLKKKLLKEQQMEQQAI